MNTKLMTAGMVAAIGLSAFCGGIQISNVQAKQRSKDTGMVDVTFDVTSSSNTVSVILSAMNTDNNATVKMNAVYDTDGNFLGNPAKIEPGNARHLVWNSALDLGKGFYSSSIVVTVRATEYDLPPSRLAMRENVKTELGKMREEAESAIPAAEQAVSNAVKAVEAVSYENLKAAEAEAEVEVAWYEEALVNAQAKYNSCVVIWQNATNALAIAQASTNQYWTITWKNSSSDTKTAEGKGTDSMIAKFAALKTFTIYEATYGNTIFINDVEKNATATCTALNKAVETALANVVKALLAKTAAERALKELKDNFEKAKDALMAARHNLANINLLQVEAAKNLEKADAKLDAAYKTIENVEKAGKILGF